jgi:2,4-dienoyl-CoA reductase-like NADH-dependent reductase (Old Yellow Enzyme family)
MTEETTAREIHAPLFRRYTFPAGVTTLRNRIVMAPMTTYSSYPSGVITPQEIAFLRRRSQGVAMTITAACYVSYDGHAFEGQWSCASDEMVPSLKEAADAIHEGGALAVLQLHHGGRLCSASILGHAPLGPSAIRARRPGSDEPREMSEAEIERTIAAFGQAARRAVRAGFDGVEIHGANGYLLQQFFSPHANRRADQWGGSVENRAAFPIAVLEEVQEIVRRNAYRPFSIGYRLSPEEADDPGISIEETLHLVEGLVACRPDWLHISTNDFFAGSVRERDDLRPRAALIADRVAGRTALIGVGSVLMPDTALGMLDAGVDLVAIARELVMEPEWVEKVAAGALDTIRTCLPSAGADRELTIPTPMYERMLGRPGWLPVCEP